MIHYDSLPEPPTEISAIGVLKRLLDGFGFRFQLSTKDLTNDEYSFRPVESSMSIEEVQLHIFHLIRLTSKSLGALNEKSAYPLTTPAETRKSILTICFQTARHMDMMRKSELEQKTIYLKRTNTEYPFWYLINGFIADAITHVGQINSWRRMAGNPVSKISPFTGESY